MSLEAAQADYDAALAALQAFDEHERQTADDLKNQRRDVNARYQAAEAALAQAQREGQPANDAPTQTVEG